jgi:hypothetical protein
VELRELPNSLKTNLELRCRDVLSRSLAMLSDCQWFGLGRPDAVVKDQGSDFNKGFRLCSEDGLVIPSVQDITHFFANLMKHHYEKNPYFKIFLKACGEVSSNLKQTHLACLVPPASPTHSRFLSVDRQFEWAERILRHSPVGGAAEGSALQKLRAAWGHLPDCDRFIEGFLSNIRYSRRIQKILKAQGLKRSTYRASKRIAARITINTIREGMMGYLERHWAIAVALKLTEVGLVVTSDPIESLIGVSKRIAAPIKDAHRTAIMLPALCGAPTLEEARQVAKITVAEEKEFLSFITLAQQRKRVIDAPGSLETLLSENKNKDFDMWPGPKDQVIPEIVKPQKQAPSEQDLKQFEEELSAFELALAQEYNSLSCKPKQQYSVRERSKLPFSELQSGCRRKGVWNIGAMGLSDIM